MARKGHKGSKVSSKAGSAFRRGRRARVGLDGRK